MKFVLKCVSELGGRRGVVSGIDRLPGFEMETPNILLYTQAGSVPHLTPDVVNLLSPAPQAAMFSIPGIASLQERMKETPMSLGEFVGLKNLAVVVTIIDPGKQRLEGFHVKNVVAVQTRSGKKEFTADSYMEFVDALKPDAFMALCDGDTTKASSNKRVSKAVLRSQEMLNNCLSLQKGWKKSTECALLVPLEGGHNQSSRQEYAEKVAATKTGSLGIVVDGLGQQGEEVAERCVADFADMIKTSLEPIDEKQLRIVHGPWNPQAVLDLVMLGIDVMDSSYPHLVTERAGALLLPLHPVENEQPPIKRSKPTTFEISLKDPIYAESFEPISNMCSCHCCSNFTKAYIHHLLNVKEMLASVLLSIHNLQQYLEFFSEIRKALDSKTFLTFKERFQ